MRTLVLLFCLTLTSCVMLQDGPVKFASLGGSSTLEGSNGMRLTHSHTRSFRDATQAVVAVAAGISASGITRSDNALKTSQNANATKTSINATNTAAEVEKLRITTAAETEALKFTAPAP